jgi:valyl-tRNA synthetase
MKIGRRLAIKVLNAARFALTFDLPSGVTEITEPVDRAMLSSLRKQVAIATKAFDDYDHTKALETTETFFWTFADDYVELVKERAYGQGDFTPAQIGSAVLALRKALGVMVRLLAPFIPYATEEVWSWWQQGSVHLSSWPKDAELAEFDNADLYTLASEALILVRKAKSDAKVSMKAEITAAELVGPEKLVELKADLMAVGKIANLAIEVGDLELRKVEFAPAE